jgi:hypothetical protein
MASNGKICISKLLPNTPQTLPRLQEEDLIDLAMSLVEYQDSFAEVAPLLAVDSPSKSFSSDLARKLQRKAVIL